MLNKVVNNLIVVFIGVLIGMVIGIGITSAPPAVADQSTESAYPLSPGSQCLSFNRFCEPKEDGGLCFECKAL